MPESPRGMPAGHMDDDGRIWTNLILLRIRRLGVRVLRARRRARAGQLKSLSAAA
jgi:hypothetical protein